MTPRILLIDDDRRLAEMVSEYLGEAGFRVVVADDGRTGLERLTREPYDALILDLMLPDMELLRRMIRNLLENARRHGAPPIEVRVNQAQGRAELYVYDHGPGIPEAEREDVFRPFRRFTGARDDREPD